MRIMKITKMAVVAAAYVALTVAFQPISYGDVQFRVSELLVLLAFYKKEYAMPLIIGCAIANIPSPLGIVDVAFGTAGTIAALVGILIVSRYQQAFGKPWIALAAASLFPAFSNGFFVGLELNLLYDVPFVAAALSVAFGELVVVCIVGVPVFTALSRNTAFMTLIDPNGRTGGPSAGGD